MKIQFRGENILNVPNAISFIRLILFPVILWIAITRNEEWFVILICISLISDLLDGNIARLFKLQTRFGAALDNLADMGMYTMAIYGIFRFRWTDIQPHAWFLYIFLGIFIFSYLVAFVRLGKIPGLHLYSAVSAGYVQGIFFCPFCLGISGLAVTWGILAYAEKTIILFKINDIRRGIKDLY